MEGACENSKESSLCAHANGMNEYASNVQLLLFAYAGSLILCFCLLYIEEQ